MRLREIFTELIEDNTCINCGNIVDENLRKWFSDKWVNIGKKKKGGGHPPCEQVVRNVDMPSVYPRVKLLV